MQAVRNKAQIWVFEALKDIQGRLPFELLGIGFICFLLFLLFIVCLLFIGTLVLKVHFSLLRRFLNSCHGPVDA
jgi:hypothetical protein